MEKNPALFVLAAVTSLSAAAAGQVVVRSALVPLTSAPSAAVLSGSSAPALLSRSVAAPLSASWTAPMAAPTAFAAPVAVVAPIAAPALAVRPAASWPVLASPQTRDSRLPQTAERPTLPSSLAAHVNAGATSEMFDGMTHARALDAAPVAASDGVPTFRPTLAAFDSSWRQAPAPAPAPAPSPARDLTMTEFGWLNAAGIALAIGAGFLLHNFWVGLLGTYVMAVPLIYLYVAARRAFGSRIRWPGVRFSPGITFAGKTYSVFPDR